MPTDQDHGAGLRAVFTRFGTRRVVSRNDRFHDTGAVPGHAYLLEEGWIARVRTGAAGVSAFTALHVAGDLVGLDAILGAPSDDELVPLTAASVRQLGMEQLRAQVSGNAGAAMDLARLLAAETVFLREALFAVGRQSSAERVCTFVLQTYRRLVAAGLVEPGAREFRLPLTQTSLAVATGLTPVHVNRTLKQLRALGWLEVRNGVAVLLDPDALGRRAEPTSTDGVAARPNGGVR